MKNNNIKVKILSILLINIIIFTASSKLVYGMIFQSNEYEKSVNTVNYSTNQSVETYDEEIRKLYKTDYKEGIMSESLEKLLLQRELISKISKNELEQFINENSNNKETFEWLSNNLEVLRLYIHGGEPIGTYINSLKVLSELYINNKEDINKANGELYKKMMVTISLTHSSKLRFWIRDHVLMEDGSIKNDADPNSESISNPLKRYDIYKNMYDNNLLDTNMFKNLTVEEMRYVLGSDISDDEIMWANYYTNKCGSRNPYSYIKYETNIDYWKPQYYEKDTYQLYDKKYNLSEYGVVNKSYYPRLWMIFEEGGVCWQISDSGQNLQASHGVPSVTVGQPGHVAYVMKELINGKYHWRLWNDVSGWTKTNATGYSNVNTYHQERLLNGWGNGSYASTYMGSYILLGAAALEDYDNYEKAENIILLANSFSSNKEKELLYKDALKIQDINLDLWLSIIELYLNDNTKTEKDYYNLARQIAKSLTYFPLPMYDMLKMISSQFVSTSYQIQYTLLQIDTLKRGAVATENDNVQYNVVRIMANYLLGNIDNEVATFSFDGENAGILSLSSKYNASNANWDFSLDGGNTWINVKAGEQKIKLLPQQLDKITVDNDIKVHIIGTNYEPQNIYTIDIKQATLPSTLFANDFENKIFSTTQYTEWKYSEETEWKNINKKVPDLNGDKKIKVRIGRYSTYLESEEIEYTFTSNIPVIDKKRSYIPLEGLSLHQYSSEQADKDNSAKNALDGNAKTFWHTNWTAIKNEERYYVIKLAETSYISGIDYLPRQDNGTNGNILKAEISVSMDGENWINVANEDWKNSKDQKHSTFEPIEANYVKIKAIESVGGFMSASLFMVFEDETKKEEQICVKGDINKDKKVTATDLLLLKRHIVAGNKQEWILTDEALKNGDINKDGNITATDLLLLKRLVLSNIK